MSDRYYNQDSRTQERSRSRDKHHSNYRGRSQSEESHHRKKPKNQKRVRFSNSYDVKIFKKEDEPNSKGMTEAQLMEYMKKMESENSVSLYSNNYDNIWDNARHRDAQLQNNSMKEQREKQKVLNEKLLSMKQEIDYYSPMLLKLPATEIKIEPAGFSSIEKDAHGNRVNDVLGCFYANRKQIPSDPSFQIQNKSSKSSTSQPKNISFDKLMFNDLKDLSINQKGSQFTDKQAKPLKGILKSSQSEIKKENTEKNQPGYVNPQLITILREINANKSLYTKEKSEILLKPYKESGQLDYLMKNPELLNKILKSSPTPKPQQPIQPPNPPVLPISSNLHRPSLSPQRPTPGTEISGSNSGYNYTEMNPPHRPNVQNNVNENPSYGNSYGSGTYNRPNYPNDQYSYNPYPSPSMGNTINATPYVNKNYRTVPCKYFHSVQGCVKGNNCTYIHDEQYAGRPSPRMQKYNMGGNMGMVTYDNENPGEQHRMSEQRNRTSAERNQGYHMYRSSSPAINQPGLNNQGMQNHQQPYNQQQYNQQPYNNQQQGYNYTGGSNYSPPGYPGAYPYPHPYMGNEHDKKR